MRARCASPSSPAPTAGTLCSSSWLGPADVGGRVFNATYQRMWLDSLKPTGQGGLDYGFGINRLSWASNAVYLHGGETVGYNSEAGYDPANKMTLVVWANLTLSPAEPPVLTASKLMLKWTGSTWSRRWRGSPWIGRTLGGGREPLWLSFGPEPTTRGERVSAPAALGPCAAPIMWDSCPTCWGQRRIFEVVYAANGEGGLLLPRSRPGCLGIGEVTRAGSREVR
jgi:hypothetical protein